MTTPLKEVIAKEFAELERLRDELRVQAHLAKLEARDAFDRLERRWPDVEQKVRDLSVQSSQVVDEAAKATRGLIEELREGYRKIQRRDKN